MIMKKKKAFSLAEVLVTVTIIGVVAVLTVPVLQTRAHNKSAVVSLKKVYSELNQALNLLAADSGTNKISRSKAFSSEENFEKYFVKKYLRVAKTCPKGPSGDCFKNASSRLVNPNQYASYQLENGVSLQFKTDLDNKVSWDITVDVNGVQPPNIAGRDIFVFKLDFEDSVITSPTELSSSVENLIKNRCVSSVKSKSYSAASWCAALLMSNGWEMNY